jgi:ABC-type polysaccharide transport system permease subunit
MPYVLSEVITALMWLFIYNPDPERGFINAVLVFFSGDAQTWLASTDLVMPSIFVALTWKYFGFHMLLFMTGLQNSRIFSTSLCHCLPALFAHLFISLCLGRSSNSSWSGS